jgi:hypothetical protein
MMQNLAWEWRLDGTAEIAEIAEGHRAEPEHGQLSHLVTLADSSLRSRALESLQTLRSSNLFDFGM